MIAKLSGVVDAVLENGVVVDVGGVGYLVYCSTRTLTRLPRPGGSVSLSIDTHVREDHIHLYGFLEPRERDWFGILQTIQGIGPRVALAILSALGPDELAGAIAVQDAARLTQAQGVGGKLAKRIVSEIKDRVPVAAVITALTPTGATSTGSGGLQGDAVSALINLGYRRSDAYTAVAAASHRLGPEVGVEELVRGSLQELSR
ncbi:MAG: Holliday junction branch migration protein RuvA [Alphaproteobacteria bacterium]|nr:Holliday junction branch migration protein RuvA [Alphaproteobacteria bacterium]